MYNVLQIQTHKGLHLCVHPTVVGIGGITNRASDFLPAACGMVLWLPMCGSGVYHMNHMSLNCKCPTAPALRETLHPSFSIHTCVDYISQTC